MEVGSDKQERLLGNPKAIRQAGSSEHKGKAGCPWVAGFGEESSRTVAVGPSAAMTSAKLGLDQQG